MYLVRKNMNTRRVWRYQREVIRIRKSKNRQHNGQKKQDKMTNNDLQNTTQKAKDRATRTSLKTGDERERLSNFPLKTQIDVKKQCLYHYSTFQSRVFMHICWEFWDSLYCLWINILNVLRLIHHWFYSLFSHFIYHNIYQTISWVQYWECKNTVNKPNINNRKWV